MKKEVKNGQGFICEDLEEKKRIWQKLTDAGYPMFFRPELDHQLTIVFIDGKFCNFGGVGELLDEAEFFGENEWTPKAGEWVEVSHTKRSWGERQYLCTIDDIHICVEAGYYFNSSNVFVRWEHIRQIKPETITLQEAQEKLRELFNKHNLTIEP